MQMLVGKVFFKKNKGVKNLLKGRKMLFIILALVFALSTVLAGCGGKTEEQPPAQAKEPAETPEKDAKEPAAEPEKPADVQELHLLIGDEPPALDSGKSTDSISFMLLNNAMEGLMRIGDGNKPVEGIAESYEASADGTKYTFKLRDAKWSDGSPVTAQDFEYAWKRALDPVTKSAYSYIMYAIKGAEDFNTGKNTDPNSVGVKALDAKTLEVTLGAPAPYFVGLTAFATFYPMKKEFVEQQGDKYAAEPANLLYNGPFVISEWLHDQKVVMKKNAQYWDASTVKLETITFDVVKENSTAVNLYEAGEIDRTGLARENVDIYKDDPNFGTQNGLVLFYLNFNTKEKAFSNKNIRKAFSLALDRTGYVNAILNNGSTPALGLVPPGVPGLSGDFRGENGDLIQDNQTQEAKKLLDQGLKELGMGKLPEIHFLSDDSDTAKKGAELLKETWRKNLGVDVILDFVPFKERLKRSHEGNFQMVFSGWGADYNDPMTFMDLFITDGPFNDTSWGHADYDAAIQFSKTTADVQARMKRMMEAEKLLMDEMPIAPVYFRGSAFVQRPYVKKLITHPFGADADFKWTYIEGKNQ
jgi:oligopeptide transport system substrate-binding protein